MTDRPRSETPDPAEEPTSAPDGQDPTERGRGRGARRPRQIPPRGWKDILFRLRDEMIEDRVFAASGSVAFFGVLAVFPALLALVSLYGIFADPADVKEQVAGLSKLLPPGAEELLLDRLGELVSTSSTTLGAGLVLAVLGALWSASVGMKAIMDAINVAYDEKEKRSFLKLRGQAILLTLGSLLVAALVFALFASVPAVVEALSLGIDGQRVVSVARWPLMGLLVMLWFSVLYRFGPCRSEPKWRWVSWGAFLATTLWLAGTAAFSFYVDRFGSYNETYGAIGSVIVFMIWLYISSFVVLLGAEVNAEMEHQTAKDSTVGPPQPMGERGAVKADTLGERRAKSHA